MIEPKSESDNLVNQSISNVKWNECEQRETLVVPVREKNDKSKTVERGQKAGANASSI